ncbi:GFA family protein [Cognatishimia sp. MH4019]|uniref:GFA family protein n=1 Tax=Cognatishimia sp. MH4019 TaxID=2854030 RepID=UPI001CD73367|nr:GFA family protein [Cognatishimia sp. MH4019]
MSASAPLTVAYCHCADCRRVSGAPVSAFAAFDPQNITITPAPETSVTVAPGVTRWFCAKCGTHLQAHYDYLPDQLYVPIGLFDDATSLKPESHSHSGSKLPWLCLTDTLPQAEGSGRARLSGAGASRKT